MASTFTWGSLIRRSLLLLRAVPRRPDASMPHWLVSFPVGEPRVSTKHSQTWCTDKLAISGQVRPPANGARRPRCLAVCLWKQWRWGGERDKTIQDGSSESCSLVSWWLFLMAQSRVAPASLWLLLMSKHFPLTAKLSPASKTIIWRVIPAAPSLCRRSSIFSSVYQTASMLFGDFEDRSGSISAREMIYASWEDLHRGPFSSRAFGFL